MTSSSTSVTTGTSGATGTGPVPERSDQERSDQERSAAPRPGVDRSWMDVASCRGVDPDALFVRGAEQNAAKQVCRLCPVRVECLADALDSRTEHGVWGGMTERERRALLRRRPEVTSWTRLLMSAREDFERTSVPAPRTTRRG